MRRRNTAKFWKWRALISLMFLHFYFLKTCKGFTKNYSLNGTQSKDVKWGVGVESANFHGFVNDGSLWNLFWCFLCTFYYRKSPILKTLGQFENLGFLIMSTRENIRLIARAPLVCNWMTSIDFRFVCYWQLIYRWANGMECYIGKQMVVVYQIMSWKLYLKSINTGKPRDAKRRSSGRIFYPTLTLMIDY